MIIDDQKEILAIREAALESLGYSVISATNSKDAIKMLQQNHVDAVLVEYKQEGIDAEAVAFHLKAHAPKVPIILLSAYSDMSERILWLVDEFVMKSAPIEELVEIIERSYAKLPPAKPITSQKLEVRRMSASA